ncbi:MAG: gamma-glutamyl-gamma-aminobutyrate hydrolase family protein [Bacteroidales bacterium]
MNSRVRPPDREALFKEVDGFAPGKKERKPPRIGISANRSSDALHCASTISEAYVQSVLLAGGAPVLIPVISDIPALAAIVSELDGLLLSGGGDINPLFLKEEPLPQLQLENVDTFRDEYDLLLLRLAYRYQVPIMGICRGHQLINAAFGGSLYQDIQAQKKNALRHNQGTQREFPSHTITLTGDAVRLRAILKSERAYVNSFHHQAVRDVAPEFISAAVAPDGINEGMEHPEYSIFSVQWHPENMAVNGNEQMLALFRYHIEEAARFARAKEIHRKVITIDSHTDTPMAYSGAFDMWHPVCGKFNAPYTEGKVSLPLMEQGRLDVVFMVAYIPQGKRTEKDATKAYGYACEKLSQIVRQERLHPTRVGVAQTVADLWKLKREGKKAIVLGLENGYAIGGKVKRLEWLKQAGIAYITLCHNGNNDICDSATDKPEWNGLSAFGRKVVRSMNRLGIMIDVSHASEDTFWEVLKKSRQPVIVSHAAARTLCNHPRNLSDEQIEALAAHGGVMQICLYGNFLRQGETTEAATLSDAIRHIKHVVNLVGIDYVGIGSDFDGGGGVTGCRASNELINITVRLLKEGYTEEKLQKLWGGNLMRVMEAVQSAAILPA